MHSTWIAQLMYFISSLLWHILWFGDRKGIWLVTGNPRRVFWTPLWDPISSKIGHLIRHHHCMFYLCMCREAAWRCPRMVRFGTRCVKFLCPISRMSRPNLILFSRWMILFYTMTCKYKVYSYRYTGAVFVFNTLTRRLQRLTYKLR